MPSVLATAIMNGTANGHSKSHSFTAKDYGQDTLLVHAGLPTHRWLPCDMKCILLTAIDTQSTFQACLLVDRISPLVILCQDSTAG